MQYIQLFARDQISNQYTELDLMASDPIRVSDAVADLADPTATPSAFSQTFRLPNTSTNGGYFKAVFNVNSEDYNPTLKADCYINIDGMFFMSGSIRLSNVITDTINNKIEYEIQFLGETRTFGGAIEGKYLADLDFRSYAHAISDLNIKKSWNAGTNSPNQLFGGDILYPLCEWGYEYNPTTKIPINSTLAIYANPGAVKGFTNSINPLSVYQFKPFMRARVIWDKIFEEAGYTYTSNFITDDKGSFFSKIYYVSTGEAEATSIISPPIINTVSTSYPIPVGPGSSGVLVFNTSPVIQDYYNAYNPVTGIYTLPFNISSGTFTCSVGINYRTNQNPPRTQCSLAFVLYRIRNGITTQLGVATRFVPISVPNQNASATVNFSLSFGGQNVGDVFFIRIFPGTFDFLTLSVNAGNLSGNFQGLQIDPSVMFPNDQYTQKDFIKGITNKFNLVWENDPDNPRNFFIEPWVEWVARGNQYDWTNKLDENVPVSIEPIFTTQSRKLIFKDSEEADLYNFSFEQANKKVFGQLNLDSNIELITGEKVISSFFAPVPLAPIANSDTFLIPHFAKDTETERQPIQVKPRLVFYNGLVNNPAGITWYMTDDFGVATAQSQYPLISQFDSYPFTNSAFDLNWTNPPQFWTGSANPNAGSGQTGVTCYTTFWEKWYNSYYSPFSRVMTASFILNNREIKNLRFNDLIFVKNSWWSPIKYSDFELGPDGRVEMEMIKIWPPIGVTIGAGGGPEPFLYFQGNLCFGQTLCQACCCEGPITTSLWTNQPDIANSTEAYATASGVFPQQGYYKSGAFSYFVTSGGAISNVFLCSSCDCSVIVPEFLTDEIACVGSTECEAFCCLGGTAEVWSDGGITGATEIYSSASGDPLTPFYWYSNGTTVVQVGASGSVVVQGTTGAGCGCGNLQYSDTLWLGVGASGQIGSCCGAGMTGASGAQSVWLDDPYFLDSSEFWTNPDETIPYGNGIEEYLSDGETWVAVTGGSPGTTGDCTINICPGRTTLVQTRLINNSGTTGASLTSQNYISFDSVNFFWANQDFATGVTFDYVYDTYYDPSSFFRNTILTGAGVTGDIVYDILENSVSIDSGTFGVTGSNSYDLPTFVSGTGSWEVQIEIIPI
jgi:hypothetical protein